MHTLETQVEIDARPERVWAVLVDFAAYPRWNPFVRTIEGQPAVGASLTVQIQPPGGRAMRFRPKLLTFDPGREMRWIGRVLLPGVFDGEHVLRIEPLGEGRVRFHQNEHFSGLLVPLMRRSLDGATRQGFVAMNEALKREAEAA